MFTGLIEGTGRIVRLDERQGEVRMRVEAPLLGEVARGASVAADGVCLTAIAQDRDGFEAVLSPETLSRTTLRRRGLGDRVNLERPLRLGDPLGGHLVLGHVDAVGVVEGVEREGTGLRVRIAFPRDLLDLIVLKGSIAVDGVSLTVAGREGLSFEVALIPETLEVTHLAGYAPGREVNLEADVMGRYIVDYLRRRAGADEGDEITRADLIRHGFTGRLRAQ